MFHAMALQDAGRPFERFEFEPGPLGEEEVEIAVESCGVCHSDLSMANNEWGMTAYPFVPSHEIVGKVIAAGARVPKERVGQRVGLGWFSSSCLTCRPCLGGDQNLCPTAEQTIVGRHGGFANRVRAHWLWTAPLPDGVNPATAGPLFCGGVTVFNPLVQFDVRPTDRVGVIGIGGLGHMAVKFLAKWGCEVVAFTSSESKRKEALDLGATRTLDSRDDKALESAAGTFDFLLSTVNVSLNWPLYLGLLAPKGRLHLVGAVGEPIPIPAFPMLVGQKSLSGSPLGSPKTMGTMLEFCARHRIEPIVERFPMSKVNEAFERLESGKARYRIVLENDLG